MKMEPVLRLTQVLKQEAEGFGLQWKDLAEYVTRQQALDREERAAHTDIELVKLQAEADRAEADPAEEEKKRADEVRMAEI